MQGLSFDVIPLMGYCFTVTEDIIKNEDGSITVMLNSDFCQRYLKPLDNASEYLYYLNISPLRAELWRADTDGNYEIFLAENEIIEALPDPLLNDSYINIRKQLFEYLSFKNDNMFFYYP